MNTFTIAIIKSSAVAANDDENIIRAILTGRFEPSRNPLIAKTHKMSGDAFVKQFGELINGEKAEELARTQGLPVVSSAPSGLFPVADETPLVPQPVGPTTAPETLKITRLEKRTLTRDLAEAFYAEHAGRPYFDRLITSVTSGPVVLLKLEGPDAISQFRSLLGATDPNEARAKRSSTNPHTIRASYGTELPDNAAHGSDSVESACREQAILWPN